MLELVGATVVGVLLALAACILAYLLKILELLSLPVRYFCSCLSKRFQYEPGGSTVV